MGSRLRGNDSPLHCAQISSATPITTTTMPKASRAVTGCLKTKREIACANCGKDFRFTRSAFVQLSCEAAGGGNYRAQCFTGAVGMLPGHRDE